MDGTVVEVTYTVVANGSSSNGTGDSAGAEVVKDEITEVNFTNSYKSDTPVTADVTISKKAITLDGAELAGAELTVEKGTYDGTVFTTTATIASWLSDGTTKTIPGLEEGTYRLTETSAPDGYLTAESIIFKIDENGDVTDKNGSAFEDNTVVMVDASARTNMLKITKTISGDITPEEFEGALAFTITAPSGASRTYRLCDGEFEKVEESGKTVYVLTLYDVEEGDYEITETTQDITGKTYSASYTIKDLQSWNGDGAEAEVTATGLEKTASVAVADGKYIAVEFNDEYEISGTDPVKPDEDDIRGFKKVNMVKYDADGTIEGVPGSAYGIFAEDDDIVTWDNFGPQKDNWETIRDTHAIVSTVTDANGDIIFKDPDGKLTVGEKYWMREIHEPDGFLISKDPVKVIFTGDSFVIDPDTEVPDDNGRKLVELITIGGVPTTIWRENVDDGYTPPSPPTPHDDEQKPEPSETTPTPQYPNYYIDTTPYPAETFPVTPNLVTPIFGPEDKYGRGNKPAVTEDVEDSHAQTEDVGAGAGVEDIGSHSSADTNAVAVVLIVCLALVLAAIGGVKVLERKK